MQRRAGERVFDVIEEKDLLFVRVSGPLDEDTRLAKRLSHLAATRVLIHAGQIEDINRFGARDWVEWMERLEAQGNSVFLLNVSVPFVQSANRLSNFCGERGQILTFHAPYHCTSCAESRELLFSVEIVGPLASAPSCICEVCGGPLEFTAAPGFFEFTRFHAGRPVDGVVQAALPRFANAELITQVATLKELSAGRAPITPHSLLGLPRPQGALQSLPRE